MYSEDVEAFIDANEVFILCLPISHTTGEGGLQELAICIEAANRGQQTD
jgi:hypothetical protein